MENNNSIIINYLIEKNNYKTYLEIGVFDGDNFNEINIENKECCDVTDKKWKLETPITYLMPSDEMFAKMPIDKKYDIIFIDGMHSEEYLDRDIINSLKHLSSNGLILCHDVLPVSYFDTTELYNNGRWTGTCWKSITKLQNQNIEFHTLEQNLLGLTIIHPHKNPYSLQYPNYKCTIDYTHVFKDVFYNEQHLSNTYTEQGKYILHVITLDEFNTLY